MKVYRISTPEYAWDLTGEGARLHGGRWNHKGMACLYTSESRALALVEYSVNVNIADIPLVLSVATIEIPEDNIYEAAIENLPDNWKDNPAPAAAKDFGTQLLKADKHAVIRIPSAVIADEYNYLLNPVLLQQTLFRLADVSAFKYDRRIKLT